MNEILSHNQRYPEIAAAARAVRAKVDASQATEEEKRRQKDILDHLDTSKNLPKSREF